MENWDESGDEYNTCSSRAKSMAQLSDILNYKKQLENTTAATSTPAVLERVLLLLFWIELEDAHN